MEEGSSRVARRKKCTRKANIKGSSRVIARLSEELIELEILPRLPVKSLLNFQRVSRRWHSLISSPYFIHLQCQSAPSGFMYDKMKTGSMIAYSSRDPSTLVSFRSLSCQIKAIRGCRVVASCNGLLCILCIHVGTLRLYMGNPYLRDWKPLPYPTSTTREKLCYGLYGLAVDVMESSVTYKLVFVIDGSPDQVSGGIEHTFEILSLTPEAACWEISKEKIILPDDICYIPQEPSAYVGGVLYWDCGTHVLWFDPKDECSGIRALPPCSIKSVRGRVGEGNKEQLIYSRMIIDKRIIEIWTTDTSSDWNWTRRHSIDLVKISEDNFLVTASLFVTVSLHDVLLHDVLHSSSDSINLGLGDGMLAALFVGGDVIIFFYIGEYLLRYNSATGKLLDIGDQPRNHYYNCLSYKNCLVPLPCSFAKY